MKKHEAFEHFVANLFKELGYSGVRHDVHYYAEIESVKTRYQIDIVYVSWFTYKFVECKYSESDNVKLREVAKFKSVLDLLDVPNRRGIVTTNQYFTARAEIYAKRNKILLLNRDDIVKLSSGCGLDDLVKKF